jgi:hypothetical protein
MAGAKSKKREELTLDDTLLRPGVSIGLRSEVANASVLTGSDNHLAGLPTASRRWGLK